MNNIVAYKEVNKYFEEINDNQLYRKAVVNEIPRLKNYGEILNTRRTLVTLKKIRKTFNVKHCGNKKSDIIFILYNVLRLRYCKEKIVRCFRKYLMYKYMRLLKSGDYINSEDFESLEPLNTFKRTDVYGLYDEENQTMYGFVLESISKLIGKYGNKAFNPYTRKEISKQTANEVKYLMKINKIMRLGVNLREENVVEFTPEEKLKFKTLNFFYEINNLGNNADSSWFDELSKEETLRFIRELLDIWEYRANLSNSSKREIYALGNPFSDVNVNHLHINNVINVKYMALKVMERLISSQNHESAALGGIYVLGALTLVNINAAEGLPWLYQSFYHGAV